VYRDAGLKATHLEMSRVGNIGRKRKKGVIARLACRPGTQRGRGKVLIWTGEARLNGLHHSKRENICRVKKKMELNRKRSKRKL